MDGWTMVQHFFCPKVFFGLEVCHIWTLGRDSELQWLHGIYLFVLFVCQVEISQITLPPPSLPPSTLGTI
jgi:hypothetical protein